MTFVGSRTLRTQRVFAASALAAFSVVLGCTPKFDLVDGDGLPLFEVQKRGVCVIGCGLRLERADGVFCSGHALEIEEGRELAAFVRCPDDPFPRDLQTEVLDRKAPTQATLGPPKSLKQRNDEAISAALTYAATIAVTN
ncbi:MAG: hypothetical protein AAF214_12650 [Pseudomonadota bacterium]